MKTLQPILVTMSLMLAACAPAYSLIPAAPVKVARNSIHVTPGTAWNKAPKSPLDVAWEENWTANGPLLDSIGFIGGLPDGQAIVKQRRKDDKKVPVFRASMTPQDIVSMIETYYRIKNGATVFETTNVAPQVFLGKPGLRFDYAFVGGDNVKRRGRSVVSISDGKLYLMTLDGAELYYFAAAAKDFDAMVATASLG